MAASISPATQKVMDLFFKIRNESPNQYLAKPSDVFDTGPLKAALDKMGVVKGTPGLPDTPDWYNGKGVARKVRRQVEAGGPSDRHPASRPQFMPELEFVNVRKSYDSPTGEHLLALDNFTLKVGGGRFVTVVGPSGCGKTTLLRMAAGLIASDSGEIRLDGAVLAGPSPKMSMVFQGIGLMPWKTIADNVALGIQLQTHRPKLG